MNRPERARKNEQAILQRLSSVGQATVAAAVKVDESTISRMKGDGKLTQFAEILAELGLKVVPETMRVFDPKDIDALLHLAKRRMDQIVSAEELGLDD